MRNYDELAGQYERELLAYFPSHIVCRVVRTEEFEKEGLATYELVGSGTFVVVIGLSLSDDSYHEVREAIIPSVYNNWPKVFVQRVAPTLGKMLLSAR